MLKENFMKNKGKPLTIRNGLKVYTKLKTKNPNKATKKGVDSSNAETWAALILFNPS